MDAASTTPRLGQPSSSSSPTSSPSVYQHSKPPCSYTRQDDFYLPEKIDPSLFPAHPSMPPTSPCATPPYSARLPYPCSPRPTSSSTYNLASSAYTRPRGLLIANCLKPWTPIILYAITSLGFLVAAAFWKAEVFEGAWQRQSQQSQGSNQTVQHWMSSRVGSSLTSISAMLLFLC